MFRIVYQPCDESILVEQDGELKGFVRLPDGHPEHGNPTPEIAGAQWGESIPHWDIWPLNPGGWWVGFRPHSECCGRDQLNKLAREVFNA